MYQFPGTREIVLHPQAAALTKLSPAEGRIRMRVELDAQEQAPVPDLERVMGLGQLARLLNWPDVNPGLETWLDAHPSVNGLDTAALFVGGYWSDTKQPSERLVARFVFALAKHTPPLLNALASGELVTAPLGIVDTLVFALGKAHALSEGVLVRKSIELAFESLHPLAPFFQAASKSEFEAATGTRVLPPPTPFPTEQYRAYACEEGDLGYYLVEHRTTEHEIIRIDPLRLEGSKLHVPFEILEPKLDERSVRELVFRCLLVDLLEDTYRVRTSLIFYDNKLTKSSTSARYA